MKRYYSKKIGIFLILIIILLSSYYIMKNINKPKAFQQGVFVQLIRKSMEEVGKYEDRFIYTDEK